MSDTAVSGQADCTFLSPRVALGTWGPGKGPGLLGTVLLPGGQASSGSRGRTRDRMTLPVCGVPACDFGSRGLCPASHMLTSLLLRDQTSTTSNLEISSPMSLPHNGYSLGFWQKEGRGKKHPFPPFSSQYPSDHIEDSSEGGPTPYPSDRDCPKPAL